MRKKPDLQTALQEFNKETPDWYNWHNLSDGEIYSNVKVIKDGAVLPTEAEVNAKLAELQAAYDEANAPYKLSRAAEYPPLAEQLDYIYHNGVEAWKTDIIDPIKARYPKP